MDLWVRGGTGESKEPLVRAAIHSPSPQFFPIKGEEESRYVYFRTKPSCRPAAGTPGYEKLGRWLAGLL